MTATSTHTMVTAALTVAAGAGVATAHGLYQVAAAARVALPIAWLYPLITDGLALVAYAATARLTDGGRRYAAGIVILAAGLSGLAQAVYLAGGITTHAVAPTGLRFGVGAWPAIAAALTAHLLHLIAGEHTGERSASNPAPATPPSSATSNSASNPPSTAAVQAHPTTDHPTTEQQAAQTDVERTAGRPSGRSARDSARAVAQRHHARHGRLPTVSELAQLAGTSRGTAGNALKDLKAERPSLHLLNNDRTES
jgi:hypothetical protein